jgi:hypothetical protein
MLSAIAYEWATGGGANDRKQVAVYFTNNSDAEMAAECIRAWGMDLCGDAEMWRDEPSPSHMELNEYTADDLAEAFGRLREHLANVAWEEE